MADDGRTPFCEGWLNPRWFVLARIAHRTILATVYIDHIAAPSWWRTARGSGRGRHPAGAAGAPHFFHPRRAPRTTAALRLRGAGGGSYMGRAASTEGTCRWPPDTWPTNVAT